MRTPITTAIALFFLALPSAAQELTGSLTGKVTIFTGGAVPGADAELEAEGTPITRFRAITDDDGVYSFAGLPSGYYTLRLSRTPGFFPLTVKSIQILNAEQRMMPTLQLGVGQVDCGVYALLDYIRLRPSRDNVGNLGGTVRVDQGQGKSELMLGVDVTLICNNGKACSAPRTDPSGEFLFKALPPGSFSVRVATPGFYPQDSPPFRVKEWIETVYQPIYVEACPRGNCDPKLPPRRPKSPCEINSP
jgi:hypothetical protein